MVRLLQHLAGSFLSPAGLIIFFRSGPFAWNGLISFWMVFFVFAAWALGLIIMTIRAVKRQRPEPGDDPAALAADLAALADEMARVKAQLVTVTEQSGRQSAADPGHLPA